MSSKDERSGGNKVFAAITGNGLLKVTRNAEEGATRNGKPAEIYKYEDLQGKEHSQWAFIYTSFTGYITDIRLTEVDISDSKSIMILEIEMNDAGEVWQISTGNKSNFAFDFLEKCMNINFSEQVKFAPWSWNKDGKLKKGITLIQGKDDQGKDIKIKSYFWGEGKGDGRINGYPVIPKKDIAGYDKDDWISFYGTTVRKFLYSFLETEIIPKLNSESVDILSDVYIPENIDKESAGEDVHQNAPDDLPF